jgi:hypothetical protein
MKRWGVAVVLALAACSKQGGPTAPQPSPIATTPVASTPAAAPPTTPTATVASAASATARALRSQGPIQGCANGWKEPAPGTALRAKPLDLLRATQGFSGTFQVVDLRYFTGPDDANLAADSKQKKPVERWYGKVVYLADPSFKIRFIAVRREVGEGVAAIAAYGTTNFTGKDWYGFDGEGGKSAYPGLPGLWPGMPYDYAAAHELPDEVIGCLAE